MEKLHIAAVCAGGAGSSAILMLNIRKALSTLGVKAKVDAVPNYLVSGYNPDIIVWR